MPETSIVVTATDRYSDAVKKMATVTKSFGKDVDKMEETLYALNKNKYSLKIDLDKAKAELKAAEKQFELTHSAADGLKLELAQANYDGMVRNLKTVTTAARDTEKAISKVENRSGGSGGGSGAVQSVVTAIAASGAGQILGDVALNMGNALAGSALGAEGATYASNALSYAATGAAMGSLIPGLGTAAGALIGAGVGLANGFIQNLQNQDEAFKSYVQESYETALSGQETALTSGSAIAGSREQTQMAFSKKLGGDEAADAYLEQVKIMARDTNYTYDEITGYSKLLLNTYDTEKTLSVLQNLSDASAGLNLDSSDVNMFIAGLSRMRTTGKTTQEYLNYFSERGVDVYQALAEGRTGAGIQTDKSEVADLVTAGKIEGADAAKYILDYINTTYGGLSEKLAGTYDAMVDNLSDYQADLDAAMGAGYNEARKSGIQAQQTWMSGESGQALEGAYGMIGQWKASLENKKEQLEREALDAVMTGTLSGDLASSAQSERLMEMAGEYQAALAEYESGNEEAGARMGALFAEAQVIAANEYNASEGAQLELESQKALVDAIRNDAVLQKEYWNAGLEMGKQFTLGRAAAISENYGGAESDDNGRYSRYHAYATGIDYVPYDNFPALLHEGERVQTAVEARSEKGGSGGVQITMYGTTIREEADVGRVATELLHQMELAGTRG